MHSRAPYESAVKKNNMTEPIHDLEEHEATG